MLDNNHRVINYLRLSVTDRCNLRCIYCMPEQGVQFTPHREILSYEEMLRIVRLCVHKGIRKVRVTGGEPLVRKEVTHFLEMLCKIEGLEEISLTTNGVLLKSLSRSDFLKLQEVTILNGCGRVLRRRNMWDFIPLKLMWSP